MKDLKDLKLPVLPDDAAGHRAYKNIVIPMVSSFDCGVGNTVWACISGAFGARGRAAEKLRFRPGDPLCPYPALNRAIAVQMITQKNLQHEELGAQFQEYVESCGKDGVPPSGFYMVSRIAARFEMDRVRQSAMTEVELLALEMSGNSLANLKEFHQKLNFVLASLREEDRPSDTLLGRWLCDKTRQCSALKRFHEQIEDSRPNSQKRRFTWLMERIRRVLMERQREQNTKSSRSALQRGPLTKSATEKQGAPGPKDRPRKPQRPKPPPPAAPRHEE